MNKSILIEEETWKKLSILKLKTGFSTYDKLLRSILVLIKNFKLEGELK